MFPRNLLWLPFLVVAFDCMLVHAAEVSTGFIIGADISWVQQQEAEGKRWFDLMRMGRRNNYARRSKLIEVIVSNAPPTQKRILAAKLTNPLGWYLPIWEDEIERNKNLVQNPYYDF